MRKVNANNLTMTGSNVGIAHTHAERLYWKKELIKRLILLPMEERRIKGECQMDRLSSGIISSIMCSHN